MPRSRITKATSVAGLIAALTGGRLPGTPAEGAAYAEVADPATAQDPSADQASDPSADQPADESTDPAASEPADDPPSDEPQADDPQADAADEEPSAQDEQPADDQAPAEQPAPQQASQPAAADEQAPAPPQTAAPALEPAAVKEKIRTFLARFFRNHPLRDDEDVFAQGFVNSLLAIQLVAFLEKEFGISIGEEALELENFRTVNAMANLVQRLRPR